jgi:hypothetical protein
VAVPDTDEPDDVVVDDGIVDDGVVDDGIVDDDEAEEFVDDVDGGLVEVTALDSAGAAVSEWVRKLRTATTPTAVAVRT